MTRALRPPRLEAAPRPDRSHRWSVRAGDEDPHDEDPFVAPSAESTLSRPSRLSRDLSRLRVLVVEDDEASAEYFAMALRIVGAQVTTASTAAEALRLVEAERPDVVLSDIAMPGRDGYWLVAAIRALSDPAISRVPVIATTAHGGAHSPERTRAAGFVDHLAKPVEPEMLWAAVARAAGRVS